MTISYLGDNYFKLQNGNDIILVDPTNARSLKTATAVVFTTLPPVTTVEEGIVIAHQG